MNKRLPVLVLILDLLAACPLALATEAASSHPADTAHASSRISPSFKEFQAYENGMTIEITVVLLQLALVIAAAKIGGAVAERFGIPGVLGELAAGVIVGPFALGGYLPIPVHGQWIPLFPSPVMDAVTHQMEWPLSNEFWFIAQLASIILLFVAGLHTNLKQFLSYLGPASIVAVGGVVLPFFFGAFTAQYFTGRAWTAPGPLFIGAIMVATSVGITARVLSDLKKLDTPEGVTILGAAVVDDVLGILVLAIVAAIAQAEIKGGDIQFGGIILITFKALGFWLGLTFLGLVLADRIEWLFSKVQYTGARLGLALALALLCSGVAEMFGLAFIIGAYSIGLALSKTKMAHQLMEDLAPINDFIVPIFFAAMGMLVNFKAMGQALTFGIVICILAIIGKVLGCGLPSLMVGFNLRGAYRVGIGMLPRGEVALILAGVGLAGGYINQSVFGVAILMTLVTTILAPLFLVPAFKIPGTGTRRESPQAAPESKPISFTNSMSPGLAKLFTQILLSSAQKDGYRINYDEAEKGLYLLRKNEVLLSIRQNAGEVAIHTVSTHADELDRLVSEAEKQILQAAEKIYPAT